MKPKSRVQLTVIVPSHIKGMPPIIGSRSFLPPQQYKCKVLLEEILRAAGMAVEAIDKEHAS